MATGTLRIIHFFRFFSILFCFLFLPLALWAGQSENYQLNHILISSLGNTLTGSIYTLHTSGGEPVVGQIYSQTLSIQSGFLNEYFQPPPTPTVTITPIRNFGGEIINENFVYAAPNPIRGHHANIVYHLAEPSEVEIKIFTTNNQLVISKHWDNVPAGENHWHWNTSNIANGVYLLVIEAKNNEGRSSRVVKKIALVK